MQGLKVVFLEQESSSSLWTAILDLLERKPVTLSESDFLEVFLIFEQT